MLPLVYFFFIFVLESFAGGSFALEDRWADAARRHAPRGLCNGYYFGTARRTYVGTVLQDPNSEV